MFTTELEIMTMLHSQASLSELDDERDRESATGITVGGKEGRLVLAIRSSTLLLCVV